MLRWEYNSTARISGKHPHRSSLLERGCYDAGLLLNRGKGIPSIHKFVDVTLDVEEGDVLDSHPCYVESVECGQ